MSAYLTTLSCRQDAQQLAHTPPDHSWLGSELKALWAYFEGASAPLSYEPGG